MVPEIAIILLGACVGAVVVVYASATGYLGHRKTKAVSTSVTSLASIDSYVPTAEQSAEQLAEVPAAEAPAAAETSPAPAAEPPPAPAPESAPSPAPALYETVQPAPAPVTYSAPSQSSFIAPPLAKKPMRTYRRRTAPVRSAAGVKKAAAKSKKQ